MTPSKKGSKSNRTENANENAAATSNPLAPDGGVTTEELNTIVAGLQQQMMNQSNLMLEKITALLAAQNGPATQRVEINVEGNSHSSPPDQQENVNAENHRTEVNIDLDGNLANGNNLNTHNLLHQNNYSQWNRNPQNVGGTTGGPPPREGGTRAQSTLYDRLCKRASEEVAGVCSVEPPSAEEYFSGMVRQIMKESM